MLLINTGELIKKLMAGKGLSAQQAEEIASGIHQKLASALEKAERSAAQALAAVHSLTEDTIDLTLTENGSGEGAERIYRDEPKQRRSGSFAKNAQHEPAPGRSNDRPADNARSMADISFRSAHAASREERTERQSTPAVGYARRYGTRESAADKARDDVYARINEMRRIEQEGRMRYKTNEEIFYSQSRYMEDFEDDYAPRSGSFINASDPQYGQYFCGFRSMSVHGIRSYFTWRTRVRHGVIETGNLSFAFIYCAELINGIGASSPRDAFDKLKAFSEGYCLVEPRLQPFAERWLREMVICYALPKELIEQEELQRREKDYLALSTPDDCSDEELFASINAVSAYKIEKSRMYKLHPAELIAASAAVYRRAFASEAGAFEKYVGTMQRLPYDIFGAALYFPREKKEGYVYALGPFRRYMIKNGKWYAERLMHTTANSAELGELMRSTDYLLRKRMGVSSTLKHNEQAKERIALIEGVLTELEAEKRRAERRKISIDLSKLDGIRTSALETQNLLLAADAEEAEDTDDTPHEDQAAPEEVPVSGNGLFTEAERVLLSCLLSGRPYQEPMLKTGVLPSVAADSINEKLFEIVGDTVLTEGENGLEIIEDYLEDVEGILTQA